MDPLHRDFQALLKCLNAHGVRYLLIGGYAVAFHGYPRPTGDLDVWVAKDLPNSGKVALAMKEFAQTEIDPHFLMTPKAMLRMGEFPFRLEILTQISGVEFEDCYSRRIDAVLDGISVTVLSKEDLLINKRASGRHKDFADLDSLP